MGLFGNNKDKGDGAKPVGFAGTHKRRQIAALQTIAKQGGRSR